MNAAFRHHLCRKAIERYDWIWSMGDDVSIFPCFHDNPITWSTPSHLNIQSDWIWFLYFHSAFTLKSSNFVLLRLLLLLLLFFKYRKHKDKSVQWNYQNQKMNLIPHLINNGLSYGSTDSHQSREQVVMLINRQQNQILSTKMKTTTTKHKHHQQQHVFSVMFSDDKFLADFFFFEFLWRL